MGESEQVDAAPRRGPGALSVLRNRNFARIFFAGVTSTAGFSIGQVALTWVVFANTGSPLDVAYIGISFVLASVVFSLVAGALVDRRERRRLMVLSDLVRAAALGTLVACLLVIGFNLAVILIVAFVLGSFTTLFQPAERALTPEVVGSEQLANANALVQTSNSIVQFASSSIGGVLIVVAGVVAAFALNTLTFITSAALIIGIVGFAGARRVPRDGTPSHPSMADDIREGFRYIVRNRALLELTLSAGLANFFFSMMNQFIVVYASNTLNAGAAVYGALLGMFALGWAPGSFMSARLQAVRYAGKTWIFMGMVAGACIVGLVALPYVAAAFALIFTAGFSLGLTNTTWLTAVQLIVPTEMQGRYFGLDQLGSFAAIPIGQVIGGLLITASSVNTDFLLAGAGVVASSGVFILSPYLRNLGLKPSAQPTS
jgi:MFS family permease